MIPDAAPGIAQAIQLAVAPALLLVGIGNCLNVVAVRLARIVDRARAVEPTLPREAGAHRDAALGELRILDRRMKVCHASVGCITASGLFTCIVIIMLFVNNVNGMAYSDSVTVLFIAAMTALAVGLLLFLAEVSIATSVVKVSREHMRRGND